MSAPASRMGRYARENAAQSEVFLQIPGGEDAQSTRSHSAAVNHAHGEGAAAGRQDIAQNGALVTLPDGAKQRRSEHTGSRRQQRRLTQEDQKERSGGAIEAAQ